MKSIKSINQSRVLFSDLQTVDEKKALDDIVKETRTTEALFNLIIKKAEKRKVKDEKYNGKKK
jgi:hypothetical protein